MNISEVLVARRDLGTLEVLSGPPQALFFEDHTYDIYLEEPGLAASQTRLNCDAPDALQEVHRTADQAHYRWRTGPDVGGISFWVERPGAPTVRVDTEVLPAKLDYLDDYEAMRTDLEQVARTLTFSLFARARQGAEPVRERGATLAEWWPVFSSLATALVAAAERITLQPRHALRTDVKHVPADRAKRLEPNWARSRFIHAKDWVPAPSAALSVRTSAGVRVTPSVYEEQQAIVTYDIPENRLALALMKRAVRDLKEMLRVIRVIAADDTSATQARSEAEATARAWLRRLQRVIASNVWSRVQDEQTPGVIPISMMQDPLYARLLRIARALSRGLKIGGAAFWIHPKQTWLLYEYWCFYKIAALLARHLRPSATDAIRFSKSSAELCLLKGKPSTILFEGPAGQRVTVAYNRLFADSPTTAQQPDIIIEVGPSKTRPGILNRMWVLDAKYRLAYSPDYVEQFGGPGPHADDVNRMHGYRDAICLAERGRQTPEYRRPVEQAVVLFPFPDEDAYSSHRFYRSVRLSGVGGLSFLPRATRLADTFLLELLGSAGIPVEDIPLTLVTENG